MPAPEFCWSSTVAVQRACTSPTSVLASLRVEMKDYADTEVLRLERELLSALPSESLRGVRGVLWQRCAGSGSLTAEPFAEIRHDLPRRSFYDLKDLPLVVAACAFSSNDDAAADKAYRAITRWMSARGFSPAPSVRSISTTCWKFSSR